MFGWSEELFESGENSSAVRMAEDDDKGSAKTLDSELDTAHLRGGYDVARDADDE